MQNVYWCPRSSHLMLASPLTDATIRCPKEVMVLLGELLERISKVTLSPWHALGSLFGGAHAAA